MHSNVSKSGIQIRGLHPMLLIYLLKIFGIFIAVIKL